MILTDKFYKGPIPETIPGIIKEGRKPADGFTVLKRRLDALKSKDADMIDKWGQNYFDLADACFVFENLVKLQPKSGFLTGIKGVVETNDGRFVAVDPEAVNSALNGRVYFTESKSETVSYRMDGETQKVEVSDVVLLPYDGYSIKFTSDQFKAIIADEIKRKDITYGRDMEKQEIVKDDEVIHQAWAIYSSGIVIPFVDETFEFNKKEYDHDGNMGFYLPSETEENAEMRALCVGGLDDRSWLYGDYGLGGSGLRLVGVVDDAEGVAQKSLEELAGKGTDVGNGLVVIQKGPD